MDDKLKVIRTCSNDQLKMIRTRPLIQTDLIKYQDVKIKTEDNAEHKTLS